jgi:6-phosphofructokinase 1
MTPRAHRTRIALLTGGGDAPGLNAVIRAVVKSAIGRGWEVLGIEDGFEGFFDRDGLHVMTMDDVRGILQTGGTVLGCSNRCNPFSYAVQEGKESVRKDRSDEVAERVETLGVDALVVIGGDGSLGIAHRLAQKGCRSSASRRRSTTTSPARTRRSASTLPARRPWRRSTACTRRPRATSE